MTNEATTRGRPGRKIGPEGKLVPLHTRVSEAERAALTAEAEAAGVSPAALVRQVLQLWLLASRRSEVQGERATDGDLSPAG